MAVVVGHQLAGAPGGSPIAAAPAPAAVGEVGLVQHAHPEVGPRAGVGLVVLLQLGQHVQVEGPLHSSQLQSLGTCRFVGW